MLVIIICVYTSTTVYWATIIVEAFSQLSSLKNSLAVAALNINKINEIYAALDPYMALIQWAEDGSTTYTVPDNWWARPTQECTGTAALTINAS